MANVVKYPKPTHAAYRPQRPIEKNQLIQKQVEHFSVIELELPPELRTGIELSSIKTEGDAAEYVRLVTKAIHKSGGRVPARVRTAT